MESGYVVSMKETEDGFRVWVPGLPGCASQGATEAEALENMREALREYLEAAASLAGEGERQQVMVRL